MSTVAEIEAAIAKLPAAQVDQLAHWLEMFRHQQLAPVAVESWLARSRGAARPGVKTHEVMALTRGEE